MNQIVINFENRTRAHLVVLLLASCSLGLSLLSGCKSPQDWRKQADERATHYLEAAQTGVKGHSESIEIETAAVTLRRRLLIDQNLQMFNPASLGVRDLSTNAYWNGSERLLEDDRDYSVGYSVTSGVLRIGLSDAIQIAARGSREYQSQKESLFGTALSLDLENTKFRSTFTGILDAKLNSSVSDKDERNTSYSEKTKLGVKREFANGTELAGGIAVDLAGMLTGEKTSAWGVLADASISIPLMRGSGKLVNMESFTQAQRNLIYAVRAFEQYKRKFMVDVASSYLGVLLSKRTLVNQEENYKRVIISTRRSRRLADANRMSQTDFDQSRQSELSARNSWIAAIGSYEASLEGFKGLVGLPPDAKVELSETDLTDLEDYVAKFAKRELGAYDAGDANEALVLDRPESVDDEEGRLKVQVEQAIALAFTNRQDFVTYVDKVEDAQRHVVIAADSLRAEVTLGGSASVGESPSPTSDEDGDFKVSDATYSSSLRIDLPFNRTSERNSYRNSLIKLESAVRAYQEAEDSMKESVRSSVRSLHETREQLKIQFLAVSLAENRVKNNDLLLQAGRAEMRDLLDAQAALLSAQNNLFSSIKNYRIRELTLQQVLGVLDVTVEGIWTEHDMEQLALWNSEQ